MAVCRTCQGSGQIRVTVINPDGSKGPTEVKNCPVCKGSGTK